MVLRPIGYPFTVIKKAPIASLLTVALFVGIALGALELESLAHKHIKDLRHILKQSIRYDTYLSIFCSLLLFLFYTAFSITAAGLQTQFIWNKGKVPLWKYLQALPRKTLHTVQTCILIVRSSLFVVFTPVIFYVMYYQYIRSGKMGTEEYTFLTVAAFFTFLIFWKHAALLCGFILVPAFDAFPRQAHYQAHSILEKKRTLLAPLFLLLLGSIVTLYTLPDIKLYKPYGQIFVTVTLIMSSWYLSSIMTFISLKTVSSGQQRQETKDTKQEVYEALQSLFEEGTKNIQETKSYDIANIVVEDENK